MLQSGGVAQFILQTQYSPDNGPGEELQLPIHFFFDRSRAYVQD